MDPNNEDLLDIDFATELPETRSKSHGLPPSFVEQFCLKVFSLEYEHVDFNQALTAIDYLRDFEYSRRQSLRAAAKRIGITKENWRDVLKDYPDVVNWVEEVQDTELNIEEWYASAFVDLRIWVSSLTPWSTVSLTIDRLWCMSYGSRHSIDQTL
jgi:hypothetical protein